MSKTEEKIDKASESYVNTCLNRCRFREKRMKQFDAYDLETAFEQGAKWALSHQWISVDKALPETDGDVLIYATYIGANSGRQRVSIEQYFYMKEYEQNGFRLKEGENRHINLKVLAWMPIPPLPEARKEDEV